MSSDLSSPRSRTRSDPRSVPAPRAPQGPRRPVRAPDRERPDARPAGAWDRWSRRIRTALAVLSALVVAATGAAWSFYHDVTSGITTTNVITGSSSGGDQNILLVGVDSRTDARGDPLPAEMLARLHGGAPSGVLNSDTIILVHVPADGSGASAFSIPRDSYVDIPGYRRDKINAAYPAAKAAAAQKLVGDGVRDPKRVDQESSQAGRSALIQTVQDLTGVTVDHYAEVNLLGFDQLTDAVGGVDVCLKAPTRDEFSGADFRAGPQTVSGAAALAFVRQRHGLAGGDLARINRQQVFLAAVAHKILAAGTLTDSEKLTNLIGAVQQSVVIDSGWDLLAFARQAADLAGGNVQFLTIPTDGTENNARGDVVSVDASAVRDFVSRHTEPVDDSGRTEDQQAPAPAPVTADIGNGAGTTGLGARVASTLAGEGVATGAVENAPPRTTSVVRYPQADGDAGARRVAAALGGIGIEQSDAVAPGRVQVLIGSDFRVPGGASPVAAPSASPAPPPITAGGVPCVD